MPHPTVFFSDRYLGVYITFKSSINKGQVDATYLYEKDFTMRNPTNYVIVDTRSKGRGQRSFSSMSQLVKFLWDSNVTILSDFTTRKKFAELVAERAESPRGSVVGWTFLNRLKPMSEMPRVRSPHLPDRQVWVVDTAFRDMQQYRNFSQASVATGVGRKVLSSGRDRGVLMGKRFYVVSSQDKAEHILDELAQTGGIVHRRYRVVGIRIYADLDDADPVKTYVNSATAYNYLVTNRGAVMSQSVWASFTARCRTAPHPRNVIPNQTDDSQLVACEFDYEEY